MINYISVIIFKDLVSVKNILKAPDAKSAKAIGRTVKNFDAEVWDKASYTNMFIAVFNKFDQNPVFKEKLLATGNKILVEGSPIDKIWGVGLMWDDPLIEDEANWTGENRLGKVLMKVRDLLKD